MSVPFNIGHFVILTANNLPMDHVSTAGTIVEQLTVPGYFVSAFHHDGVFNNGGDGAFYVATAEATTNEGVILKYDRNGDAVAAWAATTAGTLGSLWGLTTSAVPWAIDLYGSTLYVGEYGPAGSVVRRVSIGTGNFGASVPIAQKSDPSGSMTTWLALSADGNTLFYVDQNANESGTPGFPAVIAAYDLAGSAQLPDIVTDTDSSGYTKISRTAGGNLLVLSRLGTGSVGSFDGKAILYDTTGGLISSVRFSDYMDMNDWQVPLPAGITPDPLDDDRAWILYVYVGANPSLLPTGYLKHVQLSTGTLIGTITLTSGPPVEESAAEFAGLCGVYNGPVGASRNRSFVHMIASLAA